MTILRKERARFASRFARRSRHWPHARRNWQSSAPASVCASASWLSRGRCVRIRRESSGENRMAMEFDLIPKDTLVKENGDGAPVDVCASQTRTVYFGAYV